MIINGWVVRVIVMQYIVNNIIITMTKYKYHINLILQYIIVTIYNIIISFQFYYIGKIQLCNLRIVPDMLTNIKFSYVYFKYKLY